MEQLQPESMFAVVAELLAGKTLVGRYRLDRRVRTDPFGPLYEALDLDRRDPVTIRIVPTLRAHRMHTPVAPVQYPHAVEVLEVGVSELGLPYVVMEPLTGEAISDRIRRAKVIAPADALAWSLQVAEAIRAAHECGQAHGRLCGASVFLQRADTPAQTLRVLNFEMHALAPPGAVGGAALAAEFAPFSAPEAEVTAAADVYSFAVLLGSLFSGTWPPLRPTAAELGEWMTRRLPPELAVLAARALSAAPQERPGVGAFIEVIESLIAADV